MGLLVFVLFSDKKVRVRVRFRSRSMFATVDQSIVLTVSRQCSDIIEDSPLNPKN